MKRVFGAILTIFGIIAIIWSAVTFLSGGNEMGNIGVSKWEAWVPAIVGVLFFFAGIGLLKGTRDEYRPTPDR